MGMGDGVSKFKLLLDYMVVDDKVTRKEEQLMGFPCTPKQFERLVHEARLELDQLEAKAQELDRLKSRIKEAEQLYPYKVGGQHETYADYNQGWQGALNFIDIESEAK